MNKELLKEKIKGVGNKGKGLWEKLNKKAVISVCAVLILGGAVLLNFLLVPKTESESEDKLKTGIDLSDVSKAVEEKESEDTEEEKSDAFSDMSLSRQRSRDEALEVLNSVALSETAIESVKTEALAEIEQIAKDIEAEANIESLVKAKGFEECIALVSGDEASLVIRSEGLMENEVAQISEIVYNEAGIAPENLKIIEQK